MAETKQGTKHEEHQGMEDCIRIYVENSCEIEIRRAIASIGRPPDFFDNKDSFLSWARQLIRIGTGNAIAIPGFSKASSVWLITIT